MTTRVERHAELLRRLEACAVAREHDPDLVLAGLGGWDVEFCPVCDDMIVLMEGNPGLMDHCRRRGDGLHLALEVMES